MMHQVKQLIQVLQHVQLPIVCRVTSLQLHPRRAPGSACLNFTSSLHTVFQSHESLPIIVHTNLSYCIITVPSIVVPLRGGSAISSLFRSCRCSSTLSNRAISMAWRSHGSSNDELIEHMTRNGLVNSERVKQAMKSVSSQTRQVHTAISLTTL